MKKNKLIIGLMAICSLFMVACEETKTPVTSNTTTTTSEVVTTNPTSAPTSIVTSTNKPTTSTPTEKKENVAPTYTKEGKFYKYENDVLVEEVTLPVLNDTNYHYEEWFDTMEGIFTHSATGYELRLPIVSPLAFQENGGTRSYITNVSSHFRKINGLSFSYDEENQMYNIIVEGNLTFDGYISGFKASFSGSGTLTITNYLHILSFLKICSGTTVNVNMLNAGRAMIVTNLEIESGATLNVEGEFGMYINAIDIYTSSATSAELKLYGTINITDRSNSQVATAIILVKSETTTLTEATIYLSEASNITVTNFDYAFGGWGKTLYVDGDLSKVNLVNCKNSFMIVQK